MINGSDRPRPRLRRLRTSPYSGLSLVLAVLGEVLVPGPQPVPTASLLYALQGVGLTEEAARHSLAAAVNECWITAARDNGPERWRPSPALATKIEGITRRVSCLHAAPPHWNGTYLIVAVTVAWHHRAARRPLYEALSWAGLGNPTPGLWVGTHVERLTEIKNAITELDLRDSAFAFIGSIADVGLTGQDLIHRSWDLEAISTHYTELLATYAQRTPSPGDDVLFAYLRMIEQWWNLPSTDPQLPEELLPNWIGHQATTEIAALTRRWRPDAHRRWSEIVHSPPR